MRLRTRFVVALAVVALVLSATSLVGFTLYRDAVADKERADLRRTSQSVATQLETVLDEKKTPSACGPAGRRSGTTVRTHRPRRSGRSSRTRRSAARRSWPRTGP